VKGEGQHPTANTQRPTSNLGPLGRWALDVERWALNPSPLVNRSRNPIAFRWTTTATTTDHDCEPSRISNPYHSQPPNPKRRAMPMNV